MGRTQTVTILVRALWGIMFSYYNLVQWHRQRWEEGEDSLAIW